MGKRGGAPKSGPTAPVILDEHQLETLASIGCTMVEMASFFKCHVDTIRDNYSNVLARGRENGKVSVRRMMWEQAKKGNSTALKYLVHNILKERIEDRVEIPVLNSTNFDEILAQLKAARIERK